MCFKDNHRHIFLHWDVTWKIDPSFCMLMASYRCLPLPSDIFPLGLSRELGRRSKLRCLENELPNWSYSTMLELSRIQDISFFASLWPKARGSVKISYRLFCKGIRIHCCGSFLFLFLGGFLILSFCSFFSILLST